MPYTTGQVLKEKYRIEKLVGSGAFGEVYLATHLELHARRALKVLRKDAPGMGSSEIRRFEERFETEAALGARLDEINHPNLVRVYDFEHDEQTLILVMEYCPGGSLASRLMEAQRKGERLPVQEVIRIGIETAQGLAELHKLDVVHRDLKPSNILFDQQGRAKLADLGLAQTPESRYIRLGQGSLSFDHPGTVEYMPPEQQTGRSDPLRASADVYALGGVLFEALSGRMAYHQKPGTRPRDLRPDTPEWLDELVMRMLAADPKQRPWDANEVIGLLQQGQEQEQRLRREAAEQARLEEQARQRAAQARQTPLPPAHEASRKPGQAIGIAAGSAAALALIGIGVIVGLFLWLNGGTSPSERTATAYSVQMTQTSLAARLATEEPETTPRIITATQPDPEINATETPTVEITDEPGATAGSEPPANASQGDAWTSPVDGMLMAYIPAGEFEMGSNEYDDEKPIHSVYLDAFWMDVTEVTNEMFEKFVQASGYQTTAEKEGSGWVFDSQSNEWKETDGADWRHPAGPASSIDSLKDHPVVQVSWEDANTYCEWAGRRLPTEAEWEKAARGGLEGRTYPWGDEEPACERGAQNGAQFGGCEGDTAPAASFGANGYGLFDMAGNVWEWVADWYSDTYYQSSSKSNPAGPASGEYRVLRGGSWGVVARFLRAAVRLRFFPDFRYYDVGFRCAR